MILCVLECDDSKGLEQSVGYVNVAEAALDNLILLLITMNRFEGLMMIK